MEFRDCCDGSGLAIFENDFNDMDIGKGTHAIFFTACGKSPKGGGHPRRKSKYGLDSYDIHMCEILVR